MKWYVYELCDPKSGQFYIGKGCGRRMYTHLSDSHSDLVNARIKSIREKGEEPIVRELAYFYEEEDALNFEAERIRDGVNLLNKACNKVKPRAISLMDTFSCVVKRQSVSLRELQVSIDLAKQGAEKFPQLADEYAAIRGLLTKVAQNRYAPAWR